MMIHLHGQSFHRYVVGRGVPVPQTFSTPPFPKHSQGGTNILHLPPTLNLRLFCVLFQFFDVFRFLG
jgi:hypothetical protein